ncbi:MAG: hypothetical protein JWR75_849 [Devosia sp.]|nr:hypothetical protein [Devosia sp.]
MAETDAGAAGASRVAVVVLGMHRSGTSAFSRVFGLLGCDLPRSLVGADASNETGYWESQPVRALNDRILESAGTRWNDWLPVTPGWSTSLKAPGFRAAARQILRDEFGDAALFVLKDPRICRLVPFWLGTLEAEGISPRILVALRHPLDVVASLQQSNGIDPGVGHLLWLRHTLDAEFGSRGHVRLFASYEQLLSNWPLIVERSAAAFELSWPRHSNWTNAEIFSFLAYGNRRRSGSPAAMANMAGMPDWARDTHAILSRWAEAGESSADFAALDAIRTALDTAAPAFVNVIAAGEIAAAKLAASVADHEATLRQASLRFDHQLAENEAVANRALAAREREHAVAVALSAERLAKLEAEIIATRHQHAQTDSALRQRQLEAEEATAEAAQLREEIAALTARFEAQSRASADLEAASASLQANAQQHAGGDAEQARAALAAQLERHLADAIVLRDESEAAMRAARAEIGKLNESLSKTQTNSRQLEIRLGGRFDELAVLSRLLHGSETALRSALAAAIDARRWPGVPRAVRVRLQKRALISSGLFDAAWYASFYPDVAAAGVDAALHYIQHGASEGREPNPALAHVAPLGEGKNG